MAINSEAIYGINFNITVNTVNKMLLKKLANLIIFIPDFFRKYIHNRTKSKIQSTKSRGGKEEKDPLGRNLTGNRFK